MRILKRYPFCKGKRQIFKEMSQEEMKQTVSGEELEKDNAPVSGKEESQGQSQAGTGVDEKENPGSAEEKLKIQLGEMNDKYLRLYSDFDNFRKRANREKLDMIKTAASGVVSALLPVIDDMERALKAFKDNKVDTDASDSMQNALYEGVELVYQKFLGVLRHQGVSECEVMGKAFDAETAEAVAQIPAPDESGKGMVLDVIQKGYAMDGKVIRYAKVVVGC